VVIYFALLVVLCFERLAELVVSQRHAALSLGSGGIESGQGHFAVMVALHTLLLVGCWVEPIALHRMFIPALGWPMFALVILANSLRWWCIATLGSRWTARVIVMPGLPLIRTGPYRYLAHPNYVAVIVEGAALPLMGSA
jgi:methyltransferase